MKSPLAAIKDKFGDKAKLVAQLETLTKDDDLWVARVNKSKGLAHVSNAKLLKLQATFAAVKDKFGTRAKMIDAICELEKRVKDEGYKARLTAFPVPRLWDMYKSVSKRHTTAAKSADKAAKKPAAKKAAPVKAAPAGKAAPTSKSVPPKKAAPKKR